MLFIYVNLEEKPVFEKHVVFVIVYFMCPPLCKQRPHVRFP